VNYIKILEKKHQGFLYSGWQWSLCVGAGICYQILPTWSELTRRILTRVKSQIINDIEFNKIVSNIGWGYDSILQLCLNEYISRGKTLEEFYELLQEELYSDLLAEADKYNIKAQLCNFISNPFQRKNDDILALIDFFRKVYGNTTLIKLCDFLIKSKQQDKNPIAIIDFNADVLLHSVLTLFQLEAEHKKSGKVNIADFYYKAIHKTGDNDGGRIPIYHLHGSIVPYKQKKEARHNLVFLESSYSDVASSLSSWQHSIFQFYTQRTKQVFIGLSMSDLNIRRWLSWVTKILSQEIYQVAKTYAVPQKHLWITDEPKNQVEFDIKANGLSHLGVKTGFIPTWVDLDKGLYNLLNIK
jgi:hypothetical protein